MMKVCTLKIKIFNEITGLLVLHPNSSGVTSIISRKGGGKIRVQLPDICKTTLQNCFVAEIKIKREDFAGNQSEQFGDGPSVHEK